MSTIQKVYLSGLGAIGSAYASRLYESDPGLVTVIADPERIERYRRQGIVVNGREYPFRFVTPEAAAEPADLILIAVKQHHLAESIRAIRNVVGERTIILSLLNGITSEELIGAEYGPDKLLYSFVVGTDAVREGTRTRFSSMGKIVFGDKLNRTASPKVAAVKELFDRAGVPYQIPEDMLRELWWKFMMNVGVNQTSAVLKAPYGVFQKVGEARELMTMASCEVIRLAQKQGINLSEEDIRDYIGIINGLSPQGKTSMLQDVEAGRKTEVEIFAGTVVSLGRQYGVATPVNEVLLRMIRTLERTYRGIPE
ncbi:ketopantoate reductase [Hydrogenispora ethanolica]|uniref:2-dehydropantoate 2-reductase n=1 Tax=Hydrogenispora ethanolica TaxID=1082276 RepID=A0A4R1QSY1_HYDET|nr:2-dehydropantoate 2-reductase [Hydrogenispora ethanolica]TCL56173.1 ketopantoate reductase [Hydrogenispora ethanolica]